VSELELIQLQKDIGQHQQLAVQKHWMQGRLESLMLDFIWTSNITVKFLEVLVQAKPAATLDTIAKKLPFPAFPFY